MKTSGESRSLLGIWDTEREKITLGGIINFAQELQIASKQYRTENTDLCFLDRKNVYSRQTHLLSLVSKFNGLHTFYRLTKMPSLLTLLRTKDYLTWPDDKIQKNPDFSYSNTFFIRDYFRLNKSIPLLSMKKNLIRRGVNFMKKKVFPFLPVTVHLKQITGKANISNANLWEWEKFMKECGVLFPEIRFLLVGKDKITAGMEKAGNIIRTSDLGCRIEDDLALMQLSYLFLGMASGPCNMVIFNRIPYNLYKDPLHHVREMQREVGNEDRFPFAQQDQYIYRKIHNKQTLMDNFARIHQLGNIQLWFKRISEYI